MSVLRREPVERWRMAVLVALLLLMSVLAGCFAGSEDDDDGEGDGDDAGEGDDAGNGGPTPRLPPGAPGTGRDRAHFGDCSLHAIRFVVPTELAAEGLPAGFDPVHADPAGATAFMGASGLGCTNATLDGASLADVAAFELFVFVDPPADRTAPGIDEYLFQYITMVSHEEMARLYIAWDRWVELGDVSITETDAEVGRTGQVTANGPYETWELHTVVETASAECADGFLVRSFSWGLRDVASHVDTEFGAHCTGTGTAKIVLPEPFSDDPMDLAFWLLINGLLTGSGTQSWGGFDVTQRYAP